MNTDILTGLRAPADTMNLQRLGAMHQTRLSFARSLIRVMARNKWKVDTHLWSMDAGGYGTVIYKITTPHGTYHQVIFSDKIPDEDRNDRVIAEKWDITFALVQGNISSSLLTDLRNNVPLQEAGRNNNCVWVLARANKSMRVFEHVVSSLAKGEQPSHKLLSEVGYILRTTAVYGNGKFGVADFKILRENPDFRESFRAQMCAVYILREFSIDLVHYLARQRSGNAAVELDRKLQRYLGVGNATGLGMVLFLVHHPRVIDKWICAREMPLAEICTQKVDNDSTQNIIHLLNRAVQHVRHVVTIDEHQKELNICAASEIEDLVTRIEEFSDTSVLWKSIIDFIAKYSYEAQEIFISCLLEVFSDISDKYEDDINADEHWASIVGVSAGELKEVIRKRYEWAINIDFDKEDNTYWFWYRSENKAEPRVGIRHEEDSRLELPVDVGRRVQELYNAIIDVNDACSLSEFLIEHPLFTTITRRVWTMGKSIYGDIQANILKKENTPMYFLRAKLAILGATKFDPRSDKWVRVTFFQNAPLLDELHEREWLFPVITDDQHAPAENIQTQNKVRISYNEIFVYSRWAFSGLHKKFGEPLQIAAAIADMETLQLAGIKYFAKALDFLKEDSDLTPVVEVINPKEISIDLRNCSVIYHMPVLVDHLLEELHADEPHKPASMHIKNCHNRWLSLGILLQLAEKALYVHARWNNNNKAPYRVEFVLTPENRFPDIYILNKNSGNAHSIDITIGKGPLEIHIPKTGIQKHLSTRALQQKHAHTWTEGIFTEKTDWHTIKKAASKILVEDHKLSQDEAGGL